MLVLSMKEVHEDVKTTRTAERTYHLTVDGEFITVSLSGKVTRQVVKNLEHDLNQVLQPILTTGNRPVVCIDASKIKFTDVVSGARAEARHMFAELPVERWAVYGTSHLGMLIEYMGKAVGTSNTLRYFSNKRTATSWLRGMTHPTPYRPSIGLIAGISIACIGLLGLIGWQFDLPLFTRVLPSLRPINPIAAGGLIALGAAFFCYWAGALRPLRILGWVGIALGILALLPLNIDTVFYGDAVRAAGGHAELSDSAAVCFILSGILGLLANRNGRWVQPAEYTCAGIMIALAAFNLYGQLYAHDFIYTFSPTFVMALSLSLAFVITGVTMTVLVLLRRTHSALQRVPRSGWLIVIALIFVQMATYGAWNQARDRSSNDAARAFTAEATDINDRVNTRLQAYVSALHGFRGLFAASSDVSQGDFQAYYDSLNLKQTYPGLRSIAFIAAVKNQDLAAFSAKRKADNSLVPGGHPEFTFQKLSNEPLHFIATYVADSPASSSFGTDVTSIPGRSAIYNSALTSNGYYSSGTITFVATNDQPATQGFFIATPVDTANNKKPIGVVSANFNYRDFFGSILTSNQDISLYVTDGASDKTIYKSGTVASQPLSKTFDIRLAENQFWRIHIQAPANFGISTNQDRLAGAVLFGGQVFTLLLLGIFIIQIRARSQALALADAVTEDLQIERDNIAALHKKDEAMIAGIGEGLVVVDRHGMIEVTNAAALHMLGYSEADMIGKDAFEILRALDEKGELIPQSKRPIEKTLKHAKTVTTRLTYIRNDYRQLPVKVTVSPIVLHGELIGAVEIFDDITREKQLEHMKDEFLSVASHELRTPMGAIRANLSMILGGDYGPVNKDLIEPLSDMKNSTIRLVELVSDLLNVARIEAGRLKFELAELHVDEAITSVVKDLAPLGKEKGIKVSAIIPKSPKTVQADPSKVKQILTNLVGNSLKFTDKGSIVVTVIPQKDTVEVNVTDTGIGIAPDDQAKLFGKFNQITSAQAGKPAGTGLGLYISREMVRKMGGDMWIKSSTLTKGSTFAFTLPYVDSPPAKKAKHSVEQEARQHPDQV